MQLTKDYVAKMSFNQSVIDSAMVMFTTHSPARHVQTTLGKTCFMRLFEIRKY